MSEWTAETAEWYAEKYGEYATNRCTIDALDLAKDAVIVDVGCGTGAALRHAAARVSEGSLLGVDPVPRMIEIARERLVGHPAADRIELAVAPAHALPIADAVVDVALALDSFDHWRPRQREGLAEVRRILRPRGRFVIVKDAEVPSTAEDRRALLEGLAATGLRVASEATIEREGVRFTLTICVPAPSA